MSAIAERRRYLRRRDDKAAYLARAEIPLPAELIDRSGSAAGIAILAAVLFAGVVLGLIFGRFL
jgi:hypothetical protein